MEHLLHAKDEEGRPLYTAPRQGVTFAMADALCWLLATRYQILDVLELEQSGSADPAVAEGKAGRPAPAGAGVQEGFPDPAERPPVDGASGCRGSRQPRGALPNRARCRAGSS